MRTAFILLLTSFTLLVANSCKQCGTCRKYPAKDVELCRSDYATEDSYAQAFRYQEGQGYDCE